MKNRRFIQNIVIIAVLLAIVFLSQQTYLRKIGNNLYFQNLYPQLKEQVISYKNSITDWFKINIYPRVNREVAEKGEVVKEEISKQKDNIVKITWEKIKNYFAEKFSKVFGTKVE